MNVLTITGNLVKDAELRKTTNGMSVVSGTVAVQRAYKTPNGEKQTDFINFVAWDKKADYLSTYAKRGDRIEMQGRLESRKYTNSNGQEQIVWECIVENVMAFSKPKTEETKEEENTLDDDLPF